MATLTLDRQRLDIVVQAHIDGKLAEKDNISLNVSHKLLISLYMIKLHIWRCAALLLLSYLNLTSLARRRFGSSISR